MVSPIKSKFLSLNFSAIFWSRRSLILTITSIMGSVALVLGLLICNSWSAVINIGVVDKQYVSAVDVVSRFDLEFASDYPDASLKVFDNINVIQIRVDGNSSSVVSSKALSIKNVIIKIIAEHIDSRATSSSLEYENLIHNIKLFLSDAKIDKEIFKIFFPDFFNVSKKATEFNNLKQAQNYLIWSSNIDVHKEWLPFSILCFFVLSSVASFFISIVILGRLELKKKKKR